VEFDRDAGARHPPRWDRVAQLTQRDGRSPTGSRGDADEPGANGQCAAWTAGAAGRAGPDGRGGFRRRRCRRGDRVGTALDAATRGLSVALVEGIDLAAGTSSRSSKLIHGGLRYLEQLNFSLVREALRERGLLLTRLAPHLVRPVSFLYPLRHRYWERFYVGRRAALRHPRGSAGRAQAPAPLPPRPPCGWRLPCARTPWSGPSATTTPRSTTPGTP
jgi:hypothetical protein